MVEWKNSVSSADEKTQENLLWQHKETTERKKSIVKGGDRANHVVGIFTIRREGSEKTNLPSMVVGYSPATTTPELLVV